MVFVLPKGGEVKRREKSEETLLKGSRGIEGDKESNEQLMVGPGTLISRVCQSKQTHPLEPQRKEQRLNIDR
jgi:hypothetical protein